MLFLCKFINVSCSTFSPCKHLYTFVEACVVIIDLVSSFRLMLYLYFSPSIYPPPRKAGQGMIKSDLFIINKIDLAPYVGADLDVMRRDTLTFRKEKTFIFTNLKKDEGVNEVLLWIKKNCLLEGIN